VRSIRKAALPKVYFKAMNPRITVLASRAGNHRSVLNAFEAVGARTTLSAEPEVILDSDGLVIPGVGAFPAAMEDLEKRNLVATLNQFRELGKPILGICLGMQLFFNRSWERVQSGPPTPGLGWIRGNVLQLNEDGRTNTGWVSVSWLEEAKLGRGIEPGQAFYHNHSYACEATDLEVIAAYSDSSLGDGQESQVFVSAIQKDNIHGVQFHPEKSGRKAGLEVIRSFCQLVLAN
jgi:glutamine amidotransferase